MRIFNAAVAAALLSACASTGAGYSHVSVKAVSLESGAHTAPVSGVAVSLKCPNGASKELGRTESDGTLRMDADQTVTPDCTVNLAQSGYRSEEYKVSSVCTETAAGNCLSMDLRAVLSRSGEGNSAGGKQ